MNLTERIKNFFLNNKQPVASVALEDININFNVIVVEFSENVENSSGEILASMLKDFKYITVNYFNEPFDKNFLNLEGRTFFDFIEKGQTILDNTKADVLIWGYRENDKIRLNFQTPCQYSKKNTSFLSPLDSLYLPAAIFNEVDTFPRSILDLILGALISAINAPDKTTKIQQKFLLKKIIRNLSKNNSAKNLGIEFLPYIMNFLGVIYLTYCQDLDNEKEFKIAANLLDTAIQHQDLITNPMHLGCIYNHIGQLHDTAIKYLSRTPNRHYKGAISSYQLACKYLGKYIYPYDYGFISFHLSILLYDFWRQKNDIQALRDSVFNLREAEKIFTYNLFPDFWAEIEGEIGHRLNILSTMTNNNAIAEISINAYKNQQKIITEKRDPLLWAEIQENIGNIYFRIGKDNDDRELLEESLEYFHDALYIFENMELPDNIRRLTSAIASASSLLK